MENETKLTQEKPEETFAKDYNEFCRERGFRIVAIPTWKLRDDGTFSLVIQYGVEKIK